MTVQTKSWEQVGKKFEEVGTQLRRRIDVANESAAADRVAFEKVVHASLTALDDSVEAASRIVRDPALRKDLAELAVAVRAAMHATLEGAREHVRAATNVKPAKQLKAAGRKAVARKHATTKPTAKKPTATKRAATKPAGRKRPAS